MDAPWHTEVTARELNLNSGRILDRLRNGEKITVTRDGGSGVGLTDAMNVALAAAFRTTVMLSTDQRHFRMMAPLTGESGFRFLPADL